MPTSTPFGLTGGIGSGKSTVSAEFANRGAVILDADQITRDLQEPGQPVLIEMAAILGTQVLTQTGELDRQAAAAIMFADKAKHAAVHEIILPLIWGEIFEGIERAEPDKVVVVDAPLLFETQPDDLSLGGVMVVDTPEDKAVERLMQYRGFSEPDARARIATQLSREERLAKASHVIDNSGSKEQLEIEIDSAWQWMQGVLRQISVARAVGK